MAATRWAIFLGVIGTLVICYPARDGAENARGRRPTASPAMSQADGELLARARVVFGRLPGNMRGGETDTPAMIRLGQKLYYEKGLSFRRDQSCYTCHPIDGRRPGALNAAIAAPVHGQPLARDTPSVLDAGYQTAQFWDGRATDLVVQARMPLFNPHEMAMPDEQLCMKRVRGLACAAMFHEAFREKDPITLANTVRAIAAFEHTLVSRGRFDDYLEGDPQAITPQEKQGLALFMRLGCASCHNSPVVGGNLFNRVGIFRPYKNREDLGRYNLTGREFDRYVFKVPSLRNVTLTSPYYHDGQVTTLAEAVDLMAWMQLDRELTDAEIELLLRFLTTLADKPRTTAPPPRVAAPQWTPPDLSTIPDDEQGRLVRRGRELLVHTYRYLGPTAPAEQRYDGSGQSCADCHPDEGVKPYGIPWVGVTHRYPAWNKRSGRTATLEDRINECFERSLNGRAMAKDSDAMKAMIAYLAWLSRDAKPDMAGIRTPAVTPPNRAANLAAGRELFQEYCQTCHGPDGGGYRSRRAGPNGERVTPPLWGPESYNNGAGMARVLTTAAFVRANMPLGTPWNHPALTDDEAVDVAGYINSQPRPVRPGLDRDYPDRVQKPIDCPYPPYADGFSERQHRFGPFPPIQKAREAK
ncbi:MAG: cytochrome c peroxidase [Thermoguttaceae bacterium]